MINATFDLLTFLHSNFSFLFALAIYTVLAVVLAKSIKKNYKVYYWVFGLLSAGFVIPTLARVCGFTMPINLGKIPLLGLSFSELSSAANFVHPVLVIIMYMGAFSAKNKYVGRLMSIRKELSIIVGFPLIAHVSKRLFGTFVGGWNYFFDHETYIQSPRVTSVIGSGISSFVYVLGVVMFVLFLVLWITSFDSVHRKLGTKRWKSIQKWSYALYAMLFIHAMGLNLGGYISDKARDAQQAARIEMAEERTSSAQQARPSQAAAPAQGHAHGQTQAHGPAQAQGQAQAHGQASGQPQAQSHGHGHGPQAFKFADLSIGRSAKRIINMVVLVLLYGSYLFFRLRKANRNKRKKA